MSDDEVSELKVVDAPPVGGVDVSDTVRKSLDDGDDEKGSHRRSMMIVTREMSVEDAETARLRPAEGNTYRVWPYQAKRSCWSSASGKSDSSALCDEFLCRASTSYTEHSIQAAGELRFEHHHRIVWKRIAAVFFAPPDTGTMKRA
jgi:hypothetical protein